MIAKVEGSESPDVPNEEEIHAQHTRKLNGRDLSVRYSNSATHRRCQAKDVNNMFCVFTVCARCIVVY